MEKLIMGLNTEQRKSRRWGIFFKSLTFIYLFAALFLFIPGDWFPKEVSGSQQHTALVEINGVIAADEDANADTIVTALREAFEDKGTAGVILRINSPGGSPVQAGYVYDEIVRLKQLHPDTKLYSVISDIGASGGYYIAAAADEIYADKASLVGSIGVISSSFGFVDVLKKLGVERRVLTAGEHKAFLDPFTPLKASEKTFWEGVLNTTHKQFISQVKKGRGERLKEDPQLFSGLIWTGEQALELGLIDGLGSAGYVAREIIGEKNIVDFTRNISPLEKMVERFSTSFARTMSVELGLKGQLPRY
ncbi:MAG: signal peptide peptidase SppA [Motiliproteus sp.]